MKFLKAAVLLTALAALALLSRPAFAGSNNCTVDPPSAPIGTTFTIVCDGYTPNAWTNVYAVEPDGRASGLNIYGFFPTLLKANEGGAVGFLFRTEFPGLWSVPVGHYTFVVQQLGLGGTTVVENHVDVTVQSRAESYAGASLTATVDGYDVAFFGSGYAPFEAVNTWVAQPDGARCSGLGVDQLSLGALGTNTSSLWFGPGTVKADAAGNIAFGIHFNPSACIGEYTVTARALGSGRAAEASFAISGKSVTESGGAYITVSPDKVVAFGSSLVVSGWGFPGSTGVSCWFTRPDGRVLSFLNVNAKTDAGGSFAVGATLDDFPPYTSTEPGTWYVTCANTSRSALAIASFTVYALESDP